MADNVTVDSGTGITVATDEVGGAQIQRVKPVWGVDGSAVDTSATDPLPVVQTGTLNVGTVTTVTTVAAVTAISNALPAGNNNIGDVDVASIAAGDNNIGNVDIVTVPTDPFGANADASSATGSISAKLRFIASTGIPVTGTVTVGSHAVTVASGGVASGAVASGAYASGAFASGAFASGSIASGAIASGAIAAGAIATGATSIAENEDSASASLDTGVKMLVIQRATPADTAADLDYSFPQMSAGRIWTATILPSASVASGAFASGSIGSGAVASGAIASGAVASGAFASGSIASGAIASGAIAAGAIAAGATSIAENEDVASADGDRGVKIMAVRKATPVTTSNTDGDYEMLQMSVGALWTATAATDKTLLAERSINGGAEYETVAASQTAQTLGATGATGDYIAGVLVVPATTSPGNVLLLDNAISITIFTGGASSVSNLVPFFIPLGMISVSGAWKITTGANVSCIGIGNFT